MQSTHEGSSPLMTLSPVSTTQDILTEIRALKDQLRGGGHYDRIIEGLQNVKDSVTDSTLKSGALRCGPNTTFKDGKCHGDDGSRFCNAGTRHDHEKRICLPDFDRVCGPHTTLDDGKCVGNDPKRLCGPGTVYDAGTKMCAPSSSVCGTGTRYDGVLRSCVLSSTPSCANGTFYDASSNSCVATKPSSSGGDHLAGASMSSGNALKCQKTLYNASEGRCLDAPLTNDVMTDLSKAKAKCDLVGNCSGIYKPPDREEYLLMTGNVECAPATDGVTLIKSCADKKDSRGGGPEPKSWPETCSFEFSTTPRCGAVALSSSNWGCCYVSNDETCELYSLRADGSNRTVDTQKEHGGPFSVCVRAPKSNGTLTQPMRLAPSPAVASSKKPQ